jgi:hypothetical protein
MSVKRTVLLTVASVALVAPATAEATTVPQALKRYERGGRLDPARYERYLDDWKRARRAVRRLTGAPHMNLDGVLDNASVLTRRGLLLDRLVPVFLTIERNYEWFWAGRGKAVGYGTRRVFDDSPVIFEFYPGSGWQIQPLANIGRLNGLARSKSTDPATLAAYAESLLALSVNRKGALAFEYYFPWSGGGPAWVSGMTTATGMQALTRVWQRTGDSRYRDAAERMVGIFFRSPPWGVKLTRGNGRVHYLQYSQSPRLLVGNAFAQTLIGLDEFAETTGSARGRLALRRGLHQADVGMPRYDTGAWSLYSRAPGTTTGRASDLHYHELFRDFLGTLCEHFPERRFCALRDRFTRYETEPVRIGSLHTRTGSHWFRVRVWVSKPARATLTLWHGSKVVRRNWLGLAGGGYKVSWIRPRDGSYKLTLDVVSTNRIKSSRSRSVSVH